MKAITLIQPWGTLIALGEKKIETRSWKTDYRGPLLIHAGKKIEHYICHLHPFSDALIKHDMIFKDQMPSGVIIAKCNLVDCIKITDWKLDSSCRVIEATLGNGQVIYGNELEFGTYAPGRYAWLLEDIKPLNEHIPAKGKLRLWDYQIE